MTIPVVNTSTTQFLPQGMHFLAAPGAITVYDYQLSDSLLVMGGHFYAKGAVAGDFMNAWVIDKDGVIDPKATPDNPTILQIFVKNWFVIPDQIINSNNLILPNPAKAGLYLRAQYNSVADPQGSSVDVILNLQSYKVN